MSDSLWPQELQHTRPPCPSPTPGVYSNPCPSSRWYHPAISSSVIPSSSCPHSLPASGSFPMSQLFSWGGQSTGVSALASVLPMNTQDWSPLRWTGWISLQSKCISRVFSNITFKSIKFSVLSFLHSPTLTVLNGQIMVERFDKMWSTGEGNGKPLQYSCLENPMNSMRKLLCWGAYIFIIVISSCWIDPLITM